MSEEMYNKVCQPEFGRIHAILEDIKQAQEKNNNEAREYRHEMYKRLFTGNGNPSLCSRVDAHELKIQLVLWIFGSIGAALIVSVIALFVKGA